MELKFHQKIPVKFSYTWLAIILVATGYLFTLIKDYSQTLFTDSAYYFSESFLFSSFWWWFIPFCILQNKLLRKHDFHIKYKFVLYIFLVFTHVLASALFIDIMSLLFYEQRFHFWKGMGFSLAENGYILLLLYGIPFFFRSSHSQKFSTEPTIVVNKLVPAPSLISSTMIVQDGHHKVPISIKEIAYIQSSPPYVIIQTSTKKYLHKATLNSMLQQLPTDQFVRIHKTTIINIQEIASFRSRQNGDYDILLKDDSLLRLSRNYAADFKRVVGSITQDTII